MRVPSLLSHLRCSQPASGAHEASPALGVLPERLPGTQVPFTELMQMVPEGALPARLALRDDPACWHPVLLVSCMWVCESEGQELGRVPLPGQPV